MPSCVFRRCTNYDSKVNKTQGISYHMFPTNEARLQEWIAVVRKQRCEYDWTPSKSSRICIHHFKSDDVYSSNKGRTLLNKNAVPIIEQHEYLNMNNQNPPSSLEIIVGSSDIEDKTESHTTNAVNKSADELQCDNLAPPNILKKSQLPIIHKQNKRLIKRVASIRLILLDLKNNCFISDEQFLELNIKAGVLDIINRRYLKNKSNKTFRVKYPLALKRFAIKLNFYSPNGYKYVRSTFHTALPHSRILAKWYENNSCSPGFTKQAFDILKKKTSSSSKRLLCTLVAGEIPLKHCTKWTGKKTDGVVDFGINFDGMSNDIACNVYVFVLISLSDSWKLPVGYFFTKGLSADTRANLINTCISKCYASGVQVVAITFDNNLSNLVTCDALGCNVKRANCLKTTFLHSGCGIEVAVFFDPGYMLKLVRYTFEAKRIIFGYNNKKIRWSLIDALNKLQSSQSLNFSNKLSERYMQFRNEIMKIKMSTHLLSRSLVHALQLCDQLITSSKIKEIEATVEFISMFNDLFDILNTSSSGQYDYRKLITPNNATEIFNLLEKVEKYILSLKINNKIQRTIRGRVMINISKKPVVESTFKTGFLGLLICIQSLKYLFTTYVTKTVIATSNATPPLRCIASCRLNQDIVSFFGLIRPQGNREDNINTIQFKALYEKTFKHLKLRSSISGNCITLEQIPTFTCSSSEVLIINSSSGLRALDESDGSLNVFIPSEKKSINNVEILSEMLNNEYCIETIKQIVGYISGWIVLKLINIIKCETCVNTLYSNIKLWFHKLITIREMGGLCLASQDLFSVCLKSESIIKPCLQGSEFYFVSNRDKQMLKCRILGYFINSNIFDSLFEHSKQQAPAFNHRMQLIKAIIHEYVTVRINSEYRNN